ncbi:MAG: hypothetical protein LBD43_00190, partial [Holosporales bacterium]|nr:hypothetical protein [Holosporales bacterium]
GGKPNEQVSTTINNGDDRNRCYGVMTVTPQLLLGHGQMDEVLIYEHPLIQAYSDIPASLHASGASLRFCTLQAVVMNFTGFPYALHITTACAMHCFSFINSFVWHFLLKVKFSLQGLIHPSNQ